MFVYLKQGLALKKKDSFQLDPILPQGQYLLCSKPDHQENALNIVCYDPQCPKHGVLCSACFFQDHTSHSSLCCNLKDFLKKYKDFIEKEKENSGKELKEEDSQALKQGFEGIIRVMLVSKQRFEEQFNKLENALKQRELFLTNSLQNKNISDILDLINNMSQGSINTVNGYTEAMNFLLDGLTGSLITGFKDDKIKQDLMPNDLILEKVQGLRIWLECEFQRLDALYNKISKNCQDTLLDKAVIKQISGDILLRNDLEGFISEIIKKNVRISSFVRIYKGNEDGFQGRALERKLEGKQGVLALIKGMEDVFLGVYLEGLEINKKYVIFCLKEKRKVKEGRIWGACSCKDKDKMLFTSSNLHEVTVYEDGDKREDNLWEDERMVKRFRVKEIEIYELLGLG